jgi:hypothetical protein
MAVAVVAVVVAAVAAVVGAAVVGAAAAVVAPAVGVVPADAGAATVPVRTMPDHQRSMSQCAAASPGPPRCLATSGAGRASRA